MPTQCGGDFSSPPQPIDKSGKARYHRARDESPTAEVAGDPHAREAHSSSGLGHRPLKAEITGSNPVCAIFDTKRNVSISL